MDKEHTVVPSGNPLPDAARDEQGNELQDEYKDVLAEAGNISMGAAATALSHLLNRKVQISAPQISLVSMSDVRTNYSLPCLVITVQYLEGLQGENIFVMKESDALIIAGLIMGMEPPQGPAKLGEMELSALSEAMNQMMGSAATAMSEFLDCFVNISPPRVDYKNLEKEKEDFVYLSKEGVFIQIAFRIVIEGLLDSELLQLTPQDFGRHTAARLLADLTGGETEAETAATVTNTAAVAEERPLQPETEKPVAKSEEKLLAEKEKKKEKKDISSAPDHERVFTDQPEKTYGLWQEDFDRINLIKDIPVEISVVLGRTSLPLKNIFSLSPGEIFSLDNYLGEPVELLANDRLVAMGEVVMVNGKFGVKIMSVIGSKTGSRGDL
jgi:flagellar motor switch protein FliN/FliY